MIQLKVLKFNRHNRSYDLFCNTFRRFYITKDQRHGLVVRAFVLDAGRLGSILSRVKPKTLKLVSAVTLAKRSAIMCSAEDEINKE